MRDEALFLNGVYEDVLEDIRSVQTCLPEQILYLQPYSGERIVHFADNPPSADDPVRLFVSLTDDRAMVHYIGEIVGWDNKRKLEGAKLRVLNRLVYVFQPTEDGVYMQATTDGPRCVNLLYVRRLKKLTKPFSVDQLTKISTGQPVSTKRATAGGWVYVENPDPAWLAAHL
jgi:hypothetical protein